MLRDAKHKKKLSEPPAEESATLMHRLISVKTQLYQIVGVVNQWTARKRSLLYVVETIRSRNIRTTHSAVALVMAAT